MVWKLIRITIQPIIYVGQRLFKNMVLHRHVCIVFLPNPPIGILKLPYCSSRGWLNFLKRCYWLVRGKDNAHVMTKDLMHSCINQNKNIDNDLYCSSNEFPNHLALLTMFGISTSPNSFLNLD